MESLDQATGCQLWNHLLDPVSIQNIHTFFLCSLNVISPSIVNFFVIGSVAVCTCTKKFKDHPLISTTEPKLTRACETISGLK